MNDETLNNKGSQTNPPKNDQGVQETAAGQAETKNNIANVDPQPQYPKQKPKVTEEVVPKGASRHWEISEKTVAFTMVAAIVILLGVSSFISLRYMNERKNKKEIPANLLVTPTVTQISPTTSSITDWETYNSELGYTISYPTGWFATSDPSIDNADILYDKSDFPEVRSGQKLVDQTEIANYTVVGIQQFDYETLDLSPKATLTEIADSIDGVDVPTSKTENKKINDTDVLIRVIEIQKSYSIKAYMSNGNKIFVLETSLANLNDVSKIQIFNQILSTFEFTENNTRGTEETSATFNSVVSFKYPTSWKLAENTSLSTLGLPNYGGSADNSMTVYNENKCTLYLGFGGAQGPSGDIISEDVNIARKLFTKKAWYEDGKAIFISFIPQENIQGFELLWAFVSNTNSDTCLQSIDQILSTFQFLN